jgi:hypothetical protein
MVRRESGLSSGRSDAFCENVLHRNGKWVRAIAADLTIDGLEPANQIEDISAGVGSAGGGAEVRPAAKGAVFVNDTLSVLGEHRAGAIAAFRKLGAAARTKRLRGKQGFAFGEQRHRASEAKLAAFGETRARGIDGLHFGEVASRIHRAMRH